MQNEYLSHHGVIGMRWGIRNYQNPDGSLTAKGRARYAKQLRNIQTYKSLRANAKVKASTADEKAKRYAYKAAKANARLRLTDFHDDRVRRLRRKSDKYAVRAAKWNKRVAKYDKKIDRAMREIGSIKISKADKRTIGRGKNYTKKILSSSSTNQQWLMQQMAMQEAITAGNRASSLAMTGGMNPYMFG